MLNTAMRVFLVLLLLCGRCLGQTNAETEQIRAVFKTLTIGYNMLTNTLPPTNDANSIIIFDNLTGLARQVDTSK
jgi:hypothetical protein